MKKLYRFINKYIDDGELMALSFVVFLIFCLCLTIKNLKLCIYQIKMEYLMLMLNNIIG